MDPIALGARLALVKDRIAAAALRAGRPADAVALVAVSKTHPAAEVEAAIGAGQTVFGENRVQEAAAKFATLRPRYPGMRLHLIGSLQTNKARDAVRLADVIESLDRERLLEAVREAAEREGRCPELLVQVNLGGEAQKSGVARAEADRFIAACLAALPERISGVMGIPPADADPAPHFAWLAACARRHGLGVISMGMSADYEAAIAAGATHVRIGSAIFGSRPAPGVAAGLHPPPPAA